MNYAKTAPVEMRRIFRENRLAVPTSGMCLGYAQCNLIILPEKEARDFEVFAKKNPLACPVLEKTSPGDRALHKIAEDCDIAADFPKYRVYIDGRPASEPLDIKDLWRDDFVAFLIGCSFSFEDALIKADIPIRHIEQGRNVPMYLTNIDCEPAGIFSGKMVTSMRPMTPEMAEKAAEITAQMPRVHGKPVHIGDGKAIGIKDVNTPDFGDSVDINPGEVCVFWPCGVTPQSAVMQARPPIAITHAPGHMLICDVKNADLMGDK